MTKWAHPVPGIGAQLSPPRYTMKQSFGFTCASMSVRAPGEWTIIELLHRYFVSRGLVYIDESRFYSDITDPAAQAVIRKHLQSVKESIPVHPTLDTEEDDKEEGNGG